MGKKRTGSDMRCVKNKRPAKESMAVAVSGGADSLHTLIGLHESGVPVFALHAVFIQTGFPGGMSEESAKVRNGAAEAVRHGLARVCEERGIPLHIVDFSAEFMRSVIRPFVQGYADGLTPNPCVLCNSRIKFGLLLDTARELGADRLATGHYARLAHTEGEEFNPALLQGEDPQKDQSYFLAMVPLEKLALAVFPLGNDYKRDILESLARRRIAPPQPGESQEVCFVPDDRYREFLPRAAGTLGISLPGPGPMLLADGRRLGTHQGLWRYTEGQRRGLGLGWKEPLHVIAKRSGDNVLFVGPKQEMRVAGCSCNEVNILLPPHAWPDEVFVKTRYRERPKAARVVVDRSERGSLTARPRMRIRFREPDAAVAPGQIAAVYIPYETADAPDIPVANSLIPPRHGGVPLRLVAGGVISEVF